MSTRTKSNRRPLVDVAASEAQRLQSDPNVACVGIGLKFVNDKPTLEASLQYYVRAKLASDAEIRKSGSEPVPREVEGYKTDVIQWTIDRRAVCPDSKSPTGDRGGDKENPLVGGTSTTVLGDFHSFPTGYGTLGGICFDSTSGAGMALSNAHVYGDDIGNDAIQPWLPTSEYLEGAVKYLFCGGPLAHLFFWTAPSPLTAILTTAAAGAWVAAIASDAEDPSRWGQRTGPVPPGGALTNRERIHLAAEVPHLPFSGRVWRSKTQWDYVRHTTVGATPATITADRPNEHALIGKRVFTDRDVYRGGDRVTICAELWSPPGIEPIERFVVAHCFPIAEPGRISRRVLVLGNECDRYDAALEKQRAPICVRGFTPQVEGLAQMTFPIVAAPFRLWSEAGSTTLNGSALRIPTPNVINIACPPSTHVELEVFHTNKRIRATAYSANGVQIDQAESTDDQGIPQQLRLTGIEIVRIVVEGGGGEGYLAGICVDKRRIDAEQRKVVSRYYRGTLNLPLRESAGKWAVVVVSQTLDATPTGGDPVTAARQLGGIVDSSNATEIGQCACSILFDHTFDVA